VTRKTLAEDLYEAFQELGITMPMEECKQRALNMKASAAELGMTEEEYIKHNLREALGEDT
jgi:hypothetical protein